VSAFASIGDFSRMTISVKALRHYHEVGLLPPADIDPVTGYRRYAVDQVPTGQVIRRLRELGMSLDDVRAVIDAPDVRTLGWAFLGQRPSLLATGGGGGLCLTGVWVARRRGSGGPRWPSRRH
jgi:hypothetical protein